MGNASAVARISRLRGRGGLEPTEDGLGFGVRTGGGLEGSNAGALASGRRARAVLTLISGFALLALLRAAATGNVRSERRTPAPASSG